MVGTVDMVIFWKGDRRKMQPKSVTRGTPTGIRMFQPVQMSIFQCNAFKIDLDYPHFNDDASGSRETSNLGPTAQQTRFCSFSTTTKTLQIGPS